MPTSLQKQALGCLAEDQCDRAIALLEQCIETEPEVRSHYWHLGLAQLLAGDETQAQATWMAVLAAADLAETESWIGELIAILEVEAERQFQLGNLPRTQQIYEQILDANPDAANACYQLGLVRAYQGDSEGAYAAWQQAIDCDRSLVAAYRQQGVLLQQLGQCDRAIERYTQVLTLQPDDCATRYQLGLCSLDTHQLTAAIDCWQMLLQQHPDYFLPALYEWGMTLLRQGNIAAAVEKFQQALQQDATWWQSYRTWAMQLHPNQLDLATQMRLAWLEPLQASIEHPANCSALYLHLGQWLAKQGQTERAIAAYRSALETDPDNAAIHLALGQACAKQGQFARAIEHYQSAVSFQPSLVDAHLGLAQCWLASQHYEAAEQACKTALQLNPDDGKALLCLGNIQTWLNQLDAAIDSYRRAIDIQPDLLEAWCNLGITLARSGHQAEAMVCFSQVMAIDPSLASQLDGILQGLCLQRQLDAIAPEFQHIRPLDPPTDFYERAADWAAESPHGSYYPNLYPSSTLQLKPPKMLDETIHCSFHFPARIDLPAPFVAVLPEGRFWLNRDQTCSAAIAANNLLLGDLSPESPILSPGHPDSHPSRHSLLAGTTKLPPVKRIEGTVAAIAGLSNDVYFHWMFDVLPRIQLLKDSGFSFEEIDGLLVSNRLPFQQETLGLLGIPNEQLIDSDTGYHIQAKRLIVPSFAGTVSWMPRWACDFLRELFLKPDRPAEDRGHQRLYIRRDRASHRRLINEVELIAALEQQGFYSVALEALSVQEQANLFAQAEVIVAPHGGGLTNLVFCQPNTRVIEIFSPFYVYPCYWLVSNLLGLQYAYLRGNPFGSDRFHQLLYHNPRIEDSWVDVKQLLSLLAAMAG